MTIMKNALLLLVICLVEVSNADRGVIWSKAGNRIFCHNIEATDSSYRFVRQFGRSGWEKILKSNVKDIESDDPAVFGRKVEPQPASPIPVPGVSSVNSANVGKGVFLLGGGLAALLFTILDANHEYQSDPITVNGQRVTPPAIKNKWSQYHTALTILSGSLAITGMIEIGSSASKFKDW